MLWLFRAARRAFCWYTSSIQFVAWQLPAFSTHQVLTANIYRGKALTSSLPIHLNCPMLFEAIRYGTVLSHPIWSFNQKLDLWGIKAKKCHGMNLWRLYSQHASSSMCLYGKPMASDVNNVKIITKSIFLSLFRILVLFFFFPQYDNLNIKRLHFSDSKEPSYFIWTATIGHL